MYFNVFYEKVTYQRMNGEHEGTMKLARRLDVRD